MSLEGNDAIEDAESWLTVCKRMVQVAEGDLRTAQANVVRQQEQVKQAQAELNAAQKKVERTPVEGDPGTWSHCGYRFAHPAHLHSFGMNEGRYTDIPCNGTRNDDD